MNPFINLQTIYHSHCFFFFLKFPSNAIDNVSKETLFRYDDVQCLCFSFYNQFWIPFCFLFAMASILTKKIPHSQYESRFYSQCKVFAWGYLGGPFHLCSYFVCVQFKMDFCNYENILKRDIFFYYYIKKRYLVEYYYQRGNRLFELN